MMNKNTALIFAVLSGISFGSVGVFVRIFTRAGFDNILILAARVLPAVLILLILFLVFDRSLLKIRIRDIWIFACAGILGTTGMNIFFNESVTRIPLSLTAVLLCLTPAVVMLFSAVIFIEANGYEAAGGGRSSTIDGPWNKESREDYLTEVQIPVRKK